MRADGDVTLDELARRLRSVAVGEIKAGLAGTEVLPLHLLSSGKGFPSRKVREKREAAKHVESFGVGFWIRVRFPAPPP